MTDEECSRRGSEKSLEACVQGDLNIKEFNLAFNSTLHRMKRYGNPHVLPGRAKEVVRIYIGNLAPYYNNAQSGLPTAGLFFDTPELAHDNFYKIQLYMERMGRRVAPTNSSTIGPIEPAPSPTYFSEAPFGSSGPTIAPAADVSLDSGMWDLINGLERMNINEADRASILQLVRADRNRTRPASSPAVHYTMAAPPPEEHAPPFASPAAVLQSHRASQPSRNPRECWLCASTKHLAAQCPQKATRLKCTN
ncbi:hypothetical protein BG005_004712, partial [Podila minutissima]